MTAKLLWNALFIAGLVAIVVFSWFVWHPLPLLVGGAVSARVGFLGGIDQALNSESEI